MRICGIEISGSEANFLILEGTKASFEMVASTPLKLAIYDDERNYEVRNFHKDIFTFFEKYSPDIIGIKKRNKKGDMAGGPIGFKIEGLIQIFEGSEIQLVPPQTIAANLRKFNIAIPLSLKKYQHEAFKTAYTLLS